MNDKEILKETILNANRAYRSGSPIMSDQDFDDLLEQYEKLITVDEYNVFRDSLHEVKGKVKHPYILGSLNKLKAEEPDLFKKFISQHIVNDLNVSAKIDGISCRLHYENGKLISGSTRGDGSFGEDLTSKLKYIQYIPKTISIKEPLDIRGELVILKDDFEKLTGFANARNACAGLINRKEYNQNDIEKISFIAYTILGYKYTKQEQFNILLKEQFKTAWNKLYPKTEYTHNDFISVLVKDTEQDFEYDVDGLVICDSTYINEDQYRPTTCVAFKINQQIGITRIFDVEFTGPSKDGTFAPVALLEPIELGGVTVSRATLYNLDFIEKMNIKYGSVVKILRSGDVIPKIIEVIENNNECVPIEYPTHCTCCDTKLVIDGVNYRCTNKECSAQIISQVALFIKKLGVKSASEKSLINFGITNYKQLIDFQPDKKYKSQLKLYDEIITKIFTRSKFELLAALNFRGLGETLVNKIVDFYGWENISCNNYSQGLPDGIGEVILDKFKNEISDNLIIVKWFLNDSRYKYTGNNLVTAGNNKTNGMSICFTGKLNTLTRNDAEKMAIDAGFEIKAVNKKLTYLCTNDTNTGSSKNKKAKELGIKVITEEEFLKLVTNSNVEQDIFNI